MNIRPVTLDDCPGMTVLTREMGYPSSSAKMCEILQLVMSNPAHKLLIAEIEDQLAGYIHLIQSETSGDFCQIDIAALIIDINYRARGVGTAFLQEAEHLAMVQHAQQLRIRSSLISPEAFGFFQNQGFVNFKSQEMLVKEI